MASHPPTGKQSLQHIRLDSRNSNLLELRSAVRAMMEMPPIAIHHPGPGGFQASNLPFDFFRQKVIIRIEELDVFAFRKGKTAIARNIAAPVRPGLPAYLASECFNHLKAPVRRTIINHNHFNRRICLLEA